MYDLLRVMPTFAGLALLCLIIHTANYADDRSCRNWTEVLYSTVSSKFYIEFMRNSVDIDVF